MWSNQYNNPGYSFLNPESELHPYFRYKLWKQFENLGGQNIEQLPEQLKESWLKLLGQLNGSELSVKKCQGWFTSFSQHSPALFQILAAEVKNSSDSYHVMNLFSLLDDILHRIHDDDRKGSHITSDLENQIKAMLEKAYSFRDIDLSERLKIMISTWSKQQILSPQITEEMVHYLTGMLGTTSSDPGNDVSWFPAGHLPGLCSDIPYTPLDSGDLPQQARHGPPDIDDYLDARIKLFYDVIHDYRPGMAYGKICPYQKQQGQSHTTLPAHDGSYVGARARAGSSAKGLGYDRSIGLDRAVNQFRNMRKYASYKNP